MKYLMNATILMSLSVLSGPMQAEDCAAAPDARAKQACEKRTKVETACKGKAGADLKACIAAETRKTRPGY